MQINKPSQLLILSAGEVISKRNLFDLIQYSKKKDSPYWEGSDWKIYNTPQQGTNWIGSHPDCRAVIVKKIDGAYNNDGWKDEKRTIFHYSFKAKKGTVSFSEKANSSLINQAIYNYPILLFEDHKENWIFSGKFSVIGIDNSHVVLSLNKNRKDIAQLMPTAIYSEGRMKYVTHILAERNRSIVNEIKSSAPWICDICNLEFSKRYGVHYIEAHHKTPISKFDSEHSVQRDDFVLLCPNCHKAVHMIMDRNNSEYETIKDLISKTLNTQ